MRMHRYWEELPPAMQSLLLRELPEIFPPKEEEDRAFLSSLGGYMIELSNENDLEWAINDCFKKGDYVVDWLDRIEDYFSWGVVTNDGGGNTYFFSPRWFTPTPRQQEILDKLVV